MSAWWTELAPRERLLIALAGGLLAMVIVWQFLLVPTLATRAEARADLARASLTLSQLQEAYMARRASGLVEAVTPGQASVSGEAFKVLVTRAASDKGLSIARLQGGDGASVGLVFERADPRLVFYWLEEVETRLGGRVTRLTIEQAESGMVRVSVDIEGAAG